MRCEKNRLIIFTLILFTSSLFYSPAIGRPVIDSLKKELAAHTKEDPARVNLLVAISVEYYNNNNDSLRHYAHRAMALAQKFPTDPINCKVQIQAGVSHFVSSNYDSAISAYKRALQLCRKHGIDSLVPRCYNNVGSAYLRLADYPKALLYYDSVVQIAEAAGQVGELARARNNIASIYYEQGAYTPALKNYLEGLRIHEQLGNNFDIETTVLNLSNLYFRLNNYAKAKEYALHGLKLSEKTGSKWTVVSSYTTLAMILNEEKKYDSSLAYLQDAMEVAREMNNAFLINLLKGNIAECYVNMGETGKAEQLYRETLDMSVQLQDTEGVAIAKGGLGEVFLKKGNYRQAIQYMEEAFDILSNAGMVEEAKEISELLAEAYEKAGDYRSALRYHKLMTAYRDTLAKEEALKTARGLEFDYELDKKEAQIALLQKDKAIDNFRFVAAVIGMLLAAVIALLIFRNLRDAHRRNELILRQKSEIEVQAKKLEQLNRFKDNTFSVLSHDLRSPVNALTGTMAMLDEGIITPEEFAVFKNELNNKLQSVTLMLDNLLQWAQSQMKGEHTLDIEKINIRRKILKTIAVMKDAAEQKNITLSSSAPDNLYANADRNQVEMVMRNLVSNAIKFTPPGGTISINAEQQGNKAVISVTDSGVGMTQQQADRLLDGTPNASTQGTGGEKGTGIGLHLSYSFVKNNGGSMTVQSQPGKGTTFTVTLPVA